MKNPEWNLVMSVLDGKIFKKQTHVILKLWGSGFADE